MNLDDIVSLAEAAAALGVAPGTLRAHAGRGWIRARLVGRAWITTRAEVERYRREQLGRGRRQRGDSPKTDMSAESEDGQVYGG
jgi:hypothetical protein